MNYADVIRIYSASDGDATRQLYAQLEGLGTRGLVAINLLRAQKCSERAKVYLGRTFRSNAYDRKQWAMTNLCAILGTQGSLVWGWGEDPKQAYHRHVLYVDLPTGQVSFHTDQRGAGPAYPGAWDGMPNQSAHRITRWVGMLFEAES